MSLPHAAPAVLEFSQPPSYKDTQSDTAATLVWLKETIATIYLAGRETSSSHDEPPTLARSAYLDVYTTAYNYCDLTKHTFKSKYGASEPLNGQELYCCLEDIIRSHCSEVRARGFTREAETDVNGAAHATIQEYLAQWKMLTQHLAGLVARLLRYLERMWIQRELAEKRKGINTIEDLHTVIWKEEILLHVGQDSTTAAARSTRSEMNRAVTTLLQEQGQDGIYSDKRNLAERFLESLRTMDVDLEASV